MSMRSKHRKTDIFIMLLFFVVLLVEKPGDAQETSKGAIGTEKSSLDGKVSPVLKGEGEDALVLPLKRAVKVEESK